MTIEFADSELVEHKRTRLTELMVLWMVGKTPELKSELEKKARAIFVHTFQSDVALDVWTLAQGFVLDRALLLERAYGQEMDEEIVAAVYAEIESGHKWLSCRYDRRASLEDGADLARQDGFNL